MKYLKIGIISYIFGILLLLPAVSNGSKIVRASSHSTMSHLPKPTTLQGTVKPLAGVVPPPKPSLFSKSASSPHLSKTIPSPSPVLPNHPVIPRSRAVPSPSPRPVFSKSASTPSFSSRPLRADTAIEQAKNVGLSPLGAPKFNKPINHEATTSAGSLRISGEGRTVDIELKLNNGLTIEITGKTKSFAGGARGTIQLKGASELTDAQVKDITKLVAANPTTQHYAKKLEPILSNSKDHLNTGKPIHVDLTRTLASVHATTSYTNEAGKKIKPVRIDVPVGVREVAGKLPPKIHVKSVSAEGSKMTRKTLTVPKFAP